MDAVTDVGDALALAAYVQALVKRHSDGFDAGEVVVPAHPVLTSENKWLACRYGLRAPLVDLRTGSRIRTSAARLVKRTLRELEPVARELGSEAALAGIERILVDGNGAELQLAAYRESHDVVEVVRQVAERTEAAAMMPA
jgi:carboxylate-amine ligase